MGPESGAFYAGLEAAMDAARQLHRPDLEERLRIARERAVRPATVIAVIGGFKQGKSSLVNGLLGQFVCPTDDDFATSVVTVVRFGESVRVAVHRREDGHDSVEELEPSRLADLVSERGDDALRAHVERVEVEVPSPALAGGLTLVDTPGEGGLAAGLASATLAFLPFADGLIFVTDATSELSAPEMAFLASAVDRCPSVIVALTKVDIAPSWRRIAELDRGHLDTTGEQGRRVPVIPVSNALRVAALSRGDPRLDRSSGFPVLVEETSTRIIGPAKQLAMERAADEARESVAQLSASLRADLELLEHPEKLESALEELKSAQARLEHLRGPGSRWSVALNDRMADLGSRANYELRASMRAASREIDESIDSIKTQAEWERVSQTLQSHVADAVAQVFTTLEQGIQQLRRELAAMLLEEAEIADTANRLAEVDVAALWTNAAISEESLLASRAVGPTVAGLRGAQSGLSLFGLLGQFVPQGVVALLMASPLTLGVGLAFAGVNLRDARRREVDARRQKAKMVARQFLDDVQFEVGNELADIVRVRQRELRDEFSDRIANAMNVNSAAAGRARENARQAEAEKNARAAQLRAGLERLAAIDAALTHPGDQATAATPPGSGQ